MSNGNGIQDSGAMVRQDQFGGQQIATVQETAATAVAAQAKASIEARYIIAIRQPRNLDQVRTDLLRECERPSFAAVAMYNKPIGRGIEGLSIRFVEQALQCMGNVDTEAITIYDDDKKRIVEVRVTDYERNICHRKQITVTKTVERSSAKPGQSILGTRTNSYGKPVYIVMATDDDLLNKEAALVSKALRTCGLRLIPGWLQDEAETKIRGTAADRAAKDPDLERRTLIDAFTEMGVQPEDLVEYLGHDIAKVVPAELVELRSVYTTLRDGEATWQAYIDQRREQRGDVEPKAAQEAPGAAKSGKGTAALKSKIAAKVAPKTAPAAQPTIRAVEAAVALRPVVEATNGTITESDDTVARAVAIAGAQETIADNLTAKTPKTKRPSRSQAAQAARKDELGGLYIANERAAQLYVEHGDPKNKVKALGDGPPMAATEPEAPPATQAAPGAVAANDATQRSLDASKAAAEKAKAFAASKAAEERAARAKLEADSTTHDPATGEVIDESNPPPPGDSDLPDWMG